MHAGAAYRMLKSGMAPAIMGRQLDHGMRAKTPGESVRSEVLYNFDDGSVPVEKSEVEGIAHSDRVNDAAWSQPERVLRAQTRLHDKT